MTLEQEVKLAAKHAYQKAYKEACEKFDKKAEKAAEKTAKESARKLKESGVSLEIISKCTGLSLEEVKAL